MPFTRLDFNKVVVMDVESMGDGYDSMFSLAVCMGHDPAKRRVFEVSFRKNELKKIIEMIVKCNKQNFFFCGYNNAEYDWYMCDIVYRERDRLLKLSGTEVSKYLKERSNYWFENYNGMHNSDAWFAYKREHKLWPESFFVKQLDLMKIHGLDGEVSLKVMQYNMRYPSIRTLPYGPNDPVTSPMIDDIIDYNLNNDVIGTQWLFERSKDEIVFRNFVGEEYNRTLMAYGEVKIAKILGESFLMDGEKRDQLVHGDIYYKDEDGERHVYQTRYPHGIDLSDIVFDFVEMKSPQFKAVVNWITSQHVDGAKGAFTELHPDDVQGIIPFTNDSNIQMMGRKGNKTIKYLKCLSVDYSGITFDFGVGGLHASRQNAYFESDNDYLIIDVDGESWYPTISANLNVYPEHIGPVFCEFAAEVIQKKRYTLATDPMKKVYKLIANSFIYGQLKEKSSFIYDEKAALKITINGQLLLCLLAEMIMDGTEDTTLIQANTDGVTFKVNRSQINKFDGIVKAFDLLTNMNMEYAYYDYMAINNVNNYIAKYSDDEANGKDRDKLKCKGAAYSTSKDWKKDYSCLVVPKAIENYFKTGQPLEDYINAYDEAYDFTLRLKVSKSYQLWGLVDTNKESKSLSRVSVGERFYFQNLIVLIGDGGDIDEVLKGMFDIVDFKYWLKENYSKEKKIPLDDVTDKQVALKFKGNASRSQYLSLKLLEKYPLSKARIQNFSRWWFDNDMKAQIGEVRGEELLPVTSFYLAKEGVSLYKETVEKGYSALGGFQAQMKIGGTKATDIHTYPIAISNNIADFDWDNLNRKWYVKQAYDRLFPICQPYKLNELKQRYAALDLDYDADVPYKH